MVNWESNVFPGILGRTCDRPCEPACRREPRRGRTRPTASTIKPEPVAICRLKRVAADLKDDIRAPPAQAAPRKNGKRIALIGAGPASLTVARDLAPLGYECVIYDGDARAGGMIRSQIPKFRLPESVIDEEVGYVLDLGIEFRGGLAHRQPRRRCIDGGRATTRCSSAAARRADATSICPDASEAAANIHIGIDWLSQRFVRPHRPASASA